MTPPVSLVVIVPFLNEERYLSALLESVVRQTRHPDHLVLVDDGSSDASPVIAEDFARRQPWAQVLHRPRRPAERDRLAAASELGAWHWALETTGLQGDIVAKLDADLVLPPRFFEDIERSFAGDPGLGLAGGHLSLVGPDGAPRREPVRAGHVRGATKFYRWECHRQIAPVPEILGWDTIDEFSARMHGWRTATVEVAGGDALQLRPTGSHDGRFRGLRRRGLAAYGYGAHPLHVVLGAVRRTAEPPFVLPGLHYLLGWLQGWRRRAPRADPEVRAFIRSEQLRQLRGLLHQPGAT